MHTTVRVQRANHGANFRAYGLRGAAALLNPFINVEHAWMSAPTFAPHPHAGFSAVSYVFPDSETGIANRDSLGNENVIEPGGVHWTVAGRGIVHEEVPAVTGKTVHALQIFVGLPSGLRAAAAYVLGTTPHDIPSVVLPGVRVRVVAGEVDGGRSPGEPPTAVDILDISLDAGAELQVTLGSGRTMFVMPIFGPVSVDRRNFSLDDLEVPLFMAASELRKIELQASEGPAKLMIFGGKPL